VLYKTFLNSFLNIRYGLELDNQFGFQQTTSVLSFPRASGGNPIMPIKIS